MSILHIFAISFIYLPSVVDVNTSSNSLWLFPSVYFMCINSSFIINFHIIPQHQVHQLLLQLSGEPQWVGTIQLNVQNIIDWHLWTVDCFLRLAHLYKKMIILEQVWKHCELNWSIDTKFVTIETIQGFSLLSLPFKMTEGSHFFYKLSATYSMFTQMSFKVIYSILIPKYQLENILGNQEFTSVKILNSRP